MRKPVWVALLLVMNLTVLLVAILGEGGELPVNACVVLGGPLAAASAFWCGRPPRHRAAWLLWPIALLYVLFWGMLILGSRYDQPPTYFSPG
jgi:hypothetical protein